MPIADYGRVITTRKRFTTAQTNVVIIAGATGKRHIVTQVMVTVGKAVTATEVSALLGFASAVTPTDAGVIFDHPGIAPGGGAGRGDGSGVLGAGISGDALLMTSGVPTGGALAVTVTYATMP